MGKYTSTAKVKLGVTRKFGKRTFRLKARRQRQVPKPVPGAS